MTEYSKAITGSIIYGIIGIIFAYHTNIIGMLISGTLAFLRIYPAIFNKVEKKSEKETN